jgi:two-component system, NarL family, nitrate/nitrite response regulator NarL
MREETREIRLMIVDDHSLFREGLARLLAAEPDLEIVGNCDHLADALEVLDSEDVDLVLLDYDLETEQGSQFLDALKRRARKPKVLMVTAGMGGAGMLSIMEAGASGIFLKHSHPGQLAEAIRRVMEGEMWLDPRAVKAVIARASCNGEQGRSEAPLNAREKAVLKGVLEGASNKQIGMALDLSESSVKAVLQQLFGKAGVRTRGQLVRFALEHHSRDWLTDKPRLREGSKDS